MIQGKDYIRISLLFYIFPATQIFFFSLLLDFRVFHWKVSRDFHSLLSHTLLKISFNNSNKKISKQEHKEKLKFHILQTSGRHIKEKKRILSKTLKG